MKKKGFSKYHVELSLSLVFIISAFIMVLGGIMAYNIDYTVANEATDTYTQSFSYMDVVDGREVMVTESMVRVETETVTDYFYADYNKTQRLLAFYLGGVGAAGSIVGVIIKYYKRFDHDQDFVED